MKQDFKKNSLIENYNRIVRAKNQRLDEHGYYLGSSPMMDGTDSVDETIDRGMDEIMKISEILGAEETLNALVQALDDQVVMNAVEYIKRMYDMNGGSSDDAKFDEE